MRRWVFPAVMLPLLLLALAAPTLAPAQDQVPGDPSGISLDVNAILRHGRELEQQRRWDAALTHYEDARKRFPGDRTLERRYQFSRMHYDLGRRYNDSSFRRTAASLSNDDALALYAEVMLKIQTHYVDAPHWKGIIDHGNQACDVALTDEVFIKRYLTGVDQQRIDELRTELGRVMGRAAIGSRREARDAVNYAGWLAHKRLGVPRTAIVLEYTCGAANSLDDYTSFLSGGELNELYSQIRGNFVGLGIELKSHDRGLLILRVITGSPAQRSGIRAGDVITAVDGRAMRGMNSDRAADLLQGPENSVVRVSVESPGQAPRDLRVRREKVEVPSVEQVKMLDPREGVAYFQLNSFQETTKRDVEEVLWKLHRQGMKSLIVDVRGNPGGLLKAAVDVVDKFVRRGVVVSTKGRNAMEDHTYQATSSGTWSVPLVVLIDGDSASASEIFAGAIRDHRRGALVGSRTYGKGSVQGIFSLKTAGAGIRLTTAKFYSPKGHPFSKVGVDAEVKVRRAAKPKDGEIYRPPSEEDPVIAAGLRVARDKMAQLRRRSSR